MVLNQGEKPTPQHGNELLYLPSLKQHSLSSEEKNERDTGTK